MDYAILWRMLNTIHKKTGRPIAVYKTRNGELIPGLMRLKDGRWRASGHEKFTFSEPDENLAVARFHQWQAKQEKATVRVPFGGARLDDDAGLREAFLSVPQSPPDPPDPRRLRGTFLPPDYIHPQHTPTVSENPIRIEVEGDYLRFFRDPVSADTFWPWLRHLILDKPEYVAKQTGIEQIGYLTELAKPAPSPTMDELIDCYTAKQGITTDERTRCRRFWNEFVKIVGIKTIRELTHEHVEQYEVKIGNLAFAPRSIKHRYTRIRTVIAHALRRGKGQEDCRRALDRLAMLEVEDANALDPNPIAPADFWKIHAVAVKAGDKVFAAMMLFALNAAMYSSEVGAVRWDEIDLDRAEFATRRNKTRVPRVSCLWPETVRALKALPRDRETVFNTSVLAYTRFSLHRAWTNYRTHANVKDGVTFGMIRDAAFTTACRVNLDKARVLAGHRLPGSVDHYVLRAPQFVADACKAIRCEFFGKTRSKKLENH